MEPWLWILDCGSLAVEPCLSCESLCCGALVENPGLWSLGCGV